MSKHMRIIACLKLIILLCHFLVTDNRFIVYASEPYVTIISPSKNISIEEGTDLIITADASDTSGIDRVEFYNGSTLIGTVTESDFESSCYTFVWEQMQIGTYNIFAKAFNDEGNYSASEERTVLVGAYTENVISLENFDDIDYEYQADMTAVPPPTGKAGGSVGGNYNFRRGVFTNISTVASPLGKEGKSLRLLKNSGDPTDPDNATITYSGPAGLGGVEPGGIAAKQIISIEYNVYLEEKSNDVNLNLLCNTVASIGLVRFDKNGTIVSRGETLMDYNTNTWYQVRIEIDMFQKTHDVYINGERLLKQKEFVLNESQTLFETTGVYEIKYIISPSSAQSRNAIYLDDIKIALKYTSVYTTYYVDASGANGAETTISAALSNARPGDTVLVNDGLYNEPLILINQVASEYGRTTVKAVGDNALVIGRFVINGFYTRLEGFKMDGQEEISSAAVTVNNAHAEVTGMDIRNYKESAMIFRRKTQTQTNATNGYIGYNYVYGCLAGFEVTDDTIVEFNEVERMKAFNIPNVYKGDFLRPFGKNIIIRNNYVHGTREEDMFVEGYGYIHTDMIQTWDDVAIDISNVLIENNVFLGFYHQGLMLENDKFGYTGKYYIRDWIVRNNVFAGYTSWGICGGKPNGGIPNLIVENNTFVSIQGGYFGVGFDGTGGSGRVRNNIFVNQNSGLYVDRGAVMEADYNLFYNVNNASTSPGYNNIYMEPLFEDYDSTRIEEDLVYNDFRLTALSPAVDRGANVDFDFDCIGNARKFGAYVDIGAYEFQGFPAYSDNPPTVSITNSSGFTAYKGQEIRIVAEATDDFGVDRVEFYHNETQLLGIVGVEDRVGGLRFILSLTDINVGTYNITAKAIDNRGQFAYSDECILIVEPRIKNSFVSKNFDEDDFVIDDNSYPNRGAEVSGVMTDFSILRQGLDSVSTAQSPDLNDGSPNPGKSLRLHKAANMDEVSVAPSARLTYVGAGAGGEDRDGRIAGYQKLVFEADVYFGDVGINNYNLINLTYDGGKVIGLLRLLKNGRIVIHNHDTWFTPVAERWYHFKIELDASTLRANLYIDGVSRGYDILISGINNNFNVRGIESVYTEVNFAVRQQSLLYIDNLDMSVYELDIPLSAEKQIEINGIEVTGRVTLENSTGMAKKAYIILAAYDGLQMKKLDTIVTEVQKYDQHEETISMILPNANSTFKLFVWQSLIEINPLLY